MTGQERTVKVETILVTGGAGFIGSNFIRYILQKYPKTKIVNFDKLTYAGNTENLKDLEKNNNYIFIKGDIANEVDVKLLEEYSINKIVNFAAESHVDRSIESPSIFVETNIKGTQILLEAACKWQVQKYLQISTDEVYGSLGPEGSFYEDSTLLPNSPYSASKASADLLVRAYYKTFNLPINITRCSNNYGPYQFPEKLIPLIITRAMENKTIPVYGDGLNIRDWIHVEDHCEAIDNVLQQGTPGEIYNVGANNERSNLEIVKMILYELQKPETLITFTKDRLGHDRRYAVNFSKIQKELGWSPKVIFEDGLKQTVNWYLNNFEWLEKTKSRKCLEDK